MAKLGRTARYYKYGTTVEGESKPSNAKRASSVKDAKSTSINSSESQKAKRRELAKKRYDLEKKGVNLKGKDLSHTKNGIVTKDSSVNRGSTKDMPGDRRARGKKSK